MDPSPPRRTPDSRASSPRSTDKSARPWSALSKTDWLFIIIGTVAGLLSASYLVTDGFRRASELSDAQQWETHTLGVIATAEQTRSAIRNMQRGERGFLLTSDELYLQPYFEGRSEAQARLLQLRQLTRDNRAHVAKLNRLSAIVTAMDERFAKQIKDQRAHHLAAVMTSVRTGQGERLIREADKDIDQLVLAETRLLEQRREALRNADRAAWQNRLALSVLGFASLCAVLWLLFRGLASGRQIEFERERAQLAEQLINRDAQLAEQIEELNALYASAPIGLAFFSRDFRYLRINEELARINGRSVAENIGRPVREITPMSAEPIEEMVDHVFRTGEPARDIELAAAAPNDPGVPRHWLTGYYPVKNDRGDVEAVGAWVLEISERKRAEERETLLAREVDHRAKNLLAVVQSVVQLTQANDAQELKAGIIGRIQALARAHSLLAESRWDGAQLDDLVREELAPYLSGSDARVRVEGPALMLRPAAAQSLGIVLHELATNAVKYGALSTPSGLLEVRWHRKRDGLEIHWSERDGPDVEEPTLSGFGSKIIRASIERQLHGTLVQDWRPEGLQCTIRINAREALSATEPKSPA
ncbi:MAG TPA: CHASE3 domain-containing protein [Sphingomicrobium sp.]|nr:CHASE3 domain-containing protein [Sphingomicrobium sp.]